MNYPLIRIAAYHEAGHVAANIHFGVALRAVWVSPDGGGGCHRVPSGVPYVEACTAFAGPCAERQLTGEPFSLGGDRRNLEEAARQLTFRALRLAATEARDLVRARWSSIERIAEALARDGYLSGEAVTSLAELPSPSDCDLTDFHTLTRGEESRERLVHRG